MYIYSEIMEIVPGTGLKSTEVSEGKRSRIIFLEYNYVVDYYTIVSKCLKHSYGLNCFILCNIERL